ncbi:hypothetical protein [Mesonia sp. HuA40]|uniref:hypothetical protein n=1 Tax=Mesonia sp. HuA40 TaxID=2602761 RepID=UPI0011C76738|nr:hypothetical protein [Mesonia sp. HuA40]TXK73899.1 hypothetical protein FT993_03305 [Mesonia sp. HuA40]
MVKKKKYLIICVFTITLGVVLTVFYRPYIYNNNIYDFGFADVIGSLVSVIGFCTFIWTNKDYSSKIKNSHILIATFIYAILWEALGYFGLYGTFDQKDILASIFSGFLTFVIKTYIEKKYSNKN